MKTRVGFVSNSSSASFVINKNYLTGVQISKILEYLTEKNEDNWSWNNHIDTITGYTSMDNDHFSDYLEGLEVDKKSIESWR